MGFWDIATKVGKGVVDKISDDMDKCSQFREEYRGYSDEALKNKMRSGTLPQKTAAKMELQSRGY